AALVLVIFAFLSSPRTARWSPVAAWACATVLIWQVGPHTAVSLDPARSVGPAVAAANAADQWVYVVGPLAGALLAAGAWRLVPARLVTAKLFHDARYRSVLACDLPAMPVSSAAEPSAA
ncbi:MAG: aquaporin, partial [Acidimicrobiia bacterium]